jgi:hypothetical protein
MSAFMFVTPTEMIKGMTVEELDKKLVNLEAELLKVDWNTLKQCTFPFDRAHGMLGTKEKIKLELENRKNGVDNPIGVFVAGYTPKGGA